MTDQDTASIPLEVVDNADRKRFGAYFGGELAGFVEYIPMPGKVIATHTEVARTFEGRGVGSRLVAGVLSHLRADGRLIQPLCPFVASYLHRHPENADVVDQTTPH